MRDIVSLTHNRDGIAAPYKGNPRVLVAQLRYILPGRPDGLEKLAEFYREKGILLTGTVKGSLHRVLYNLHDSQLRNPEAYRRRRQVTFIIGAEQDAQQAYEDLRPPVVHGIRRILRRESIMSTYGQTGIDAYVTTGATEERAVWAANAVPPLFSFRPKDQPLTPETAMKFMELAASAIARHHITAIKELQEMKLNGKVK